MNVYKMAWLPDGWHYGKIEFINSEDCMGHTFSDYRITATLWKAGKRINHVLGVGNTPQEALNACNKKIEKELP